MKVTYTKQLSRAALDITEGLFSRVFDLALWFVVYGSALSVPQSQNGQIWRAQFEADKFLRRINYDVIKHAIMTAKRAGYIKRCRRHTWPEITEEGYKRLRSVLPIYDTKRIWDGRMHMVTYDIPEKRHHDRTVLRDYLLRLGCRIPSG